MHRPLNDKTPIKRGRGVPIDVPYDVPQYQMNATGLRSAACIHPTCVRLRAAKWPMCVSVGVPLGCTKAMLLICGLLGRGAGGRGWWWSWCGPGSGLGGERATLVQAVVPQKKNKKNGGGVGGRWSIALASGT